MSTFFADVSYTYEKALIDLVPYDSYSVNQSFVFPQCIIKFTKDNNMTTYELKADKHAYKHNTFKFDFKYDDEENIIPDTTRNYFAYFVLKPFNDFDLYIIPVKDIMDNIEKNMHKHIIQTPNKQYYVFDINIYSNYKQKI